MLGVYRILASRTELHLVEAYVKAASAEDAEGKFYGAIEDEASAISWRQVFDSSDTEIDSVELVPADHDPIPSDDRSHCLLLRRDCPVRTGASAEESPDGHRHLQARGYTWMPIKTTSLTVRAGT